MRVNTKICGIRSESDLQVAVSAGADAVGFISGLTHYSEDGLEARAAARLSALAKPAGVQRVLVTHLQDAGEILALANAVDVDCIQVHGLVDLETLRAVRAGAQRHKILRAVHVTGPAAILRAMAAAPYCDGILLDSRTAGRLGGTGRTHDWAISRQIAAALRGTGTEVVLAGGLTAANVGEAIEKVRPHGVDVNSGVEDGSGHKLARACMAFTTIAHYASANLPARLPSAPQRPGSPPIVAS